MNWLLQTPQGSVVVIVALAVLGVLFYLFPALLGLAMGIVHWRGVLVVNALLGWTVLGWIAALVWVLLDRPRDPDRDAWPSAREEMGSESGRDAHGLR